MIADAITNFFDEYVMVKQCLDNIPILFLCIFGNIIIGTVTSTAKKKDKFDIGKFVDGICKSIAITLGIFILAVAFERFDLSSLGFTPVTIISIGVLVYAAKIAKHVVTLLGIADKFNITDGPNANISGKGYSTDTSVCKYCGQTLPFAKIMYATVNPIDWAPAVKEPSGRKKTEEDKVENDDNFAPSPGTLAAAIEKPMTMDPSLSSVGPVDDSAPIIEDFDINDEQFEQSYNESGNGGAVG